jgi:hypothetical protein
MKAFLWRNKFRTLLIAAILLLLALSIISARQGCRPSTEHLPRNAIVVYGDSRSGHRVHDTMVRTILKTAPVAVFHTGDLVNDGASSADWATFNGITAELVESTPFYPALGNHDLPPELYLDNFDLPHNERWYSLEVDGRHFVVLDSTSDLTPGSEQYQWLEAKLGPIADDFAAVVFHHPVLSTGSHGDELGLGSVLIPLFEQYDVELVLNGHDHDYERSFKDGTYYVVTGGGGAPLRQQAGGSPYSQVFKSTYHFCTLSAAAGGVTFEAFDLDLRSIDRFTIEEP